MRSDTAATKLPYRAPVLTVHGDIAALTSRVKGSGYMDGGNGAKSRTS
jgi:hypothetical protein